MSVLRSKFYYISGNYLFLYSVLSTLTRAYKEIHGHTIVPVRQGPLGVWFKRTYTIQ